MRFRWEWRRKMTLLIGVVGYVLRCHVVLVAYQGLWGSLRLPPDFTPLCSTGEIRANEFCFVRTAIMPDADCFWPLSSSLTTCCFSSVYSYFKKKSLIDSHVSYLSSEWKLGVNNCQSFSRFASSNLNQNTRGLKLWVALASHAHLNSLLR